MLSTDEARDIVEQSGINMRKIAKRTNIIYVYLSEYLNNKRILSQEEMQRLNEYLEQVKTII